MNIGEKIKILRKEKKLTQEQLAEYLHVSSQAVSKWETGVSTPDVDMLPKLAVFFHTSMDELFDFDRRRIDEEVAALVTESVPLRKDPPKAEAFYRAALEKYPNNEVLLNCLLMVIPHERSAEKLEIGEKLLDCTRDDEIRLDVLRLLALTCHAIGEQSMAEHYLALLPELYFLKNEIAAEIKSGAEQQEQIRETESVCLGTLLEMLALRKKLAAGTEGQRYDELARAVLELSRALPEGAERTERLERAWNGGAMLDFLEA